MINYTVDERVLVYPLRDPSMDINKDKGAVKRFVNAIDALTILFSSSQNSIFLSRNAIDNLNKSRWALREYELKEMVSKENSSSVGKGYEDKRMSYRELDAVIRNDPKLKYITTKDYLTRYRNMLHFDKNADNPAKPWRNRKFKTLSFEDQFFYSNTKSNNINDLKNYLEDKKKNYDYADNSVVDSLKLKYPYRDIPIDDKIKLLSYLNNDIYSDSDKHFLIINSDSDCLTVPVKKINEGTLLENPVKLKGIQAKSIKKEPVVATSFFDAYNKAKTTFADGEDSYLLFGKDIEAEINIKKEDWQKTENGTFACPPDRLYYYLETLKDVVIYKKDKEMPIDEIARYFGCNCSSESSGMKECKFLMDKRKWSVGKKKEMFKYHLKPSTKLNDDDDNEDTLRIYFKWNNKKHQKQDKDGIVIGMILTHPASCPILQEYGKARLSCPYTDNLKINIDGTIECSEYTKNQKNF